MIIYGSSSLGACTKQQVALRMDYEPMAPPADMQKIFDAGHEYEAKIISRLLDEGRPIDFLTEEKGCLGRWNTCTQHETMFKVSNDIGVLCHLDGIERVDEHVNPTLEVKSMSRQVYDSVPHNNNVWDEPGLIQKYKWQVSVPIVVRKQPTIVLFGCRDSDEYFEVVVEKPFYTEAEIRARVLSIEAQARQGVLPESCDNKGYPCPVYYVTRCQGEVEWGDEEVAALGVTYKGLVAEKKRIETREKETRTLLLAAARGDDDSEFVEKKVATDSVSVSFYKGRSKPSVNWDQIELDYGIDKEKYKTPGSEYQAVRVTVKKGKDDGD